ncbi:hypothetical protein KAS14_04910 [Candidatus Bathyarchaeota archaeon]|nr:hypothetical protein [Candidatus Bathyarchaeota archaeon]
MPQILKVNSPVNETLLKEISPEKKAPEHGCFESNINVVTTYAPPRDKIIGSVPDRGTLQNL